MAIGVGEWTLGPAIGRGSSATVSLAVDRRTGAVFAVKSVGAARAGELWREQSILRGLSSPHVVRCLGYSGASSAEWCYLFLEYAPGGSLADEIKRCGGRCEERLIRSRARDILRGLAHVHAAGIAHCDVKGRNVLIGTDGRAMIADFGCARRVSSDGGGIGAEKLRGGTPMFMAPEAARGEEQGTAVDIWALGCTVIEMANGGSPWPLFLDPISALHHVALSGEVPEFPQWLSEDGKDFLARCLRRDPRERWTAEQLLQHQFVATAASSSSNSIQSVTEKEMFASPKSVLDQVLWDVSMANTEATTAPTDRLRALAAGTPVVPDWTWDANWITVHPGDSDSDDNYSVSPETELEADTGRDSHARGSAAASVSGLPTAAEETSHGHGNFYDDAISSCSGESTDSFCGGNHVVRDCNLAITSNGLFHRCSGTFVLCCPADRLRFACSLFFRFFSSYFSQLQPTMCDCKLAAWRTVI
ncbi:mitogen-activated protein kinase kinase kinase 18-like [Phragmites australis]|uniref:mitogen-activated protein kinase kinase kinase 18-like n=1 Tax=Phragmites australis TaxID=29695 RepID=UPI002D7816BE|nr:mitogen-activated protein kinase kinase kinase 18-like [Phragmites australis]